MHTVKLEAIARGLFHLTPYYLEASTGQVMAGFIVPEDKKVDSDQYMLLPRFSIAHIEQTYLRQVYGDSDEYKEYELDTYPTFPIVLTDELLEKAKQYSHRAHIFIMDRLDRKAEIEYEAFRKNFRIEFAEKWCKDNRIAFEYVFKKNE